MIEKMLREKIGLNYDSIGRKNVESAISMHMKKHGMNNTDDYFELLSNSDKHFEELTQTVLVPETWFFRYSESFAFLAQYAGEYLAGNLHPIHILSIPCSTGEEPHSIAMTLLNAGVPPGLIHIDAVDVSGPAIESAKLALYGSNSFRGGIPENMLRFFHIKDGKYEVVQQVKELVKFHKHSIFAHKPLAEHPRYNLIFCRNLLIYFATDEQVKAVTMLSEMLTDDGIIFLGHVESGMVNRRDFESVKYPSSFAFRKKNKAESKSDEAHKKNVKTFNHTEQPAKKTLHKTQRFNVPAVKIQNEDAILKKASSMADSGNLQAAETLCRQYIELNKLNPVAYYILGVIDSSSGRFTEAEKAFSKALYLDPGYYEALIHMALLKERQGEQTEASRIRKRAEKLANESKS